MLPTVTTVCELRAKLHGWRKAGETIGFVPTMGALHAGHMELVKKSQGMVDRTVTYIFVNPMQFAPHEDLDKYPRQLEADKKLLTEQKCDLLYAPTVGEIYPEGFSAKIDPGPIAAPLEGMFRPGFFTGVATVVIKMLMQSQPNLAFFGEKDYQQLQVIRRVVTDLDLPVQIVGVPTVREADGLALSSRNAYLSPDERKRAVLLPDTMKETIRHVLGGMPVDKALEAGKQKLEQGGFKVDYLELADASTLQPLRNLEAEGRLLAAAKLGATRLIDNMPVDRK